MPAKGPLPGPAFTAVPVSRALLQRPTDWPDSTHITGAWHEPVGEVPDDETVEFLTQGRPTIYAGFGSMALGNPLSRADAIIAAIRATGHKALIATGWGGLQVPAGAWGNDVLVRTSFPHDTTLSHTVASIHHGGAGTVHAALRSGSVSVIAPFIADQFYWGNLLHRRELSPKPLSQRINGKQLLKALRAIPQYEIENNRVAREMKKEDGIEEMSRLLSEL